MYDITFQQIEVFLTVAECMNLSRAAELLSYSQPALSKALAKLEKSIGMQLFYRSNQGMTLTPNGAYLISLIEPLYKNLNQNIRDIRSNARTQEKTLRIAAPILFDYSDDFVFNISFQLIEAFLAVAKHLNLTKAGEATSISQSALSKILKRFEKAVGMQLFIRTSTGVALTSEGEELYAVLEPQYAALEKAIWFAQNNVTPEKPNLRILEPSSYDYAEEFDGLKDIVRQYAHLYPDVELREYQCDFKELRQALEYGGADLVFTQDFGIYSMQNISIRRVSEISMYVAMSGKHSLAQSDGLDISALENEVFLTTRTTDTLQTDIKNFMEVCQFIGFTPKSIRCLPNFESFLYANTY
jgi:DNA-binding transcriptional LysR family regulator